MSDKILKLSQAQTLYQDLRGRIDALPTDSDIPEVPVQDVQVNGTSVLNNGIANVPFASTENYGVVRVNNSYGIGTVNNSGATLKTYAAGSSRIKEGTQAYMPIVPNTQHESTFYGLAKAAGADMASSSNSVGTYTGTAKQKIQNMLGITDILSTEESSTATAAHTVNSLFLMDGKLYKTTAAIAIGDAVTIGTNCEVVKADEVFVKNTDYASSNIYGIVKIGNGLGINSSNGKLQVNSSSSGNVKIGTDGYAPIVPGHQHESVFYGLSKVAGVDLANETVTLGTYPSTSKIAIRKMIDALGPSNINDGLILEANAEDGSWALSTNVQDVQINGTSIVNNGIANISKASTSTFGVVKTGGYGVSINNDGVLYVYPAGISAEIKPGTSNYLPIVPSTQHASVYYGLSKLAGVDLASETVTVGTYPTASKTAIRNLIGATSSNVIAVQDEQPTDTDTKIWLPETENTGIQVPTMEDMANYVLKTDIASSTNYGIVKATNYYGVDMIPTGSDAGFMRIYKAPSDQIKAGVNNYRPIVPSTQHEGVFYGLAKAAGDTTQTSSDNAVGTYTDDAKTAIRTMLGAISNTDYATANNAGVVTINVARGINSINGELQIIAANDGEVQGGVIYYKPIIPARQHQSVFYGLAKAAGDTTQAASSNAVGIYTAEAKAAIHTMLGIDPASIAAQVDIPLVETVSGTTPTITGQPNVRYVCGEVSTISITPPAGGSVDVIFESGSTATTMTVPSTVKWPVWFDAEALEANTTYEILITDGIYGSVMTWAT